MTILTILLTIEILLENKQTILATIPTILVTIIILMTILTILGDYPEHHGDFVVIIPSTLMTILTILTIRNTIWTFLAIVKVI